MRWRAASLSGRGEPPLGASAVLTSAATRGTGAERGSMGMMSSVPLARLLVEDRPLASAMASAEVPYRRARLARVCPRATTWVRNVTRFSGGRFARHSPAEAAAPEGTLTFH